jgi:hypothetical protein
MHVKNRPTFVMRPRHASQAPAPTMSDKAMVGGRGRLLMEMRWLGGAVIIVPGCV